LVREHVREPVAVAVRSCALDLVVRMGTSVASAEVVGMGEDVVQPAARLGVRLDSEATLGEVNCGVEVSRDAATPPSGREQCGRGRMLVRAGQLEYRVRPVTDLEALPPDRVVVQSAHHPSCIVESRHSDRMLHGNAQVLQLAGEFRHPSRLVSTADPGCRALGQCAVVAQGADQPA
jgi:hypothetical protein